MFYYSFDASHVKRKNIEKQDNFYFAQAGEIFEPKLNIQDVYEKAKKRDIKDFLGEYNYFFEDEDSVYIFSDELGAIKWFYYHDNHKFCVGNNLWYIAKELDLGVEDIRVESFYDSMLFCFPLDNRTFFNSLKVLPSGSLLIYSKKSKQITIEKLKPIKYQKESYAKNDWFARIDNAFQKTIDKIKEFNKDPYFAITISGGLDSRFPLFYTKHIKKKIAYLIGINKSFLEAQDHKSAKKLASYFKISLLLINPFKNIEFEEKMLIDVARNPIGPSNVLKAINKKKSFLKNEQFDILLTGAYGGLIGGRILNDDLLETPRNNLADKMFIYYSEISSLEEYKSKSALSIFLQKRINRILVHFGVIKKQEISFEDEIKRFLNDNFLIPIKYKKKTKELFDKLFYDIEAKDNLSLIMNFHLHRHMNRGTFESLQGQVKAYSIYYPYIYDLSKKWDVKYLKGRRLMEEFLLWKDEETSKIQLQSFEIPLHLKFKKTSRLKKFFLKITALSSFVIRGLVINYNRWWKHPSARYFYNRLEQQPCQTFDDIFRKEDVDKIYSYGRYNLLTEHILKLKYILILIEKKEYDKLINLDILETDKY